MLDPGQNITIGENVPLKVGKLLEKANALVVILSWESARSTWLRHEVEDAIGSPNCEHRVVSVMVEPTDDVPWILRKLPRVIGKNPAKAAGRVLGHLKEPKED